MSAWPEPAEGRRPARACIRAAREEFDRAWQETQDYRLIVIHLRSGVDWLRRGLEQLADISAEEVEHTVERARQADLGLGVQPAGPLKGANAVGDQMGHPVQPEGELLGHLDHGPGSKGEKAGCDCSTCAP